jgi:rhamnulose-1-phosphate aldolase
VTRHTTQYELSDPVAEVARDMAEVGSHLWTRGWAERNAGNLSADVTDLLASDQPDLRQLRKLPAAIRSSALAGRSFLITATGARLRELATRPGRGLLLVRIEDDLDGYRVVWGGQPTSRATSELPAHLEIHGLLRDGRASHTAIVHTHPTHLIALTHFDSTTREHEISRLLWSMHPEVRVVLPDGVGFAPYRCPGTEDLAAATVEALQSHRLCLWEKHGCVCVGRDVLEAFDLIDTVDKAAEIYLLCCNAGHPPQGLDSDQLDELARTFDLDQTSGTEG